MSTPDLPSPAVGAVKDALAGRGDALACSWLVGEPCFAPPDSLRRSFVVRAGSQAYHYGPPGGLPELREVLAGARWSGTDGVAATQLTVTHGAKSAVLLVLATLLEAGDEVLCPLPCFPSYPYQVGALGGRFVPVPWDATSGGSLRAAVEEHASSRSRALLLSSPCNPTGRVLDAGTVASLVELCRERGMTLINDEVYEAFRFRADAPSTAAVSDPRREVVVQVRSLSKTLALCGWRIGFIVSSAQLAGRLAARQSVLLNPPSTTPQQALLGLDEVPAAFQASACDVVRRRCGDATAALRAAGLEVAEPDGGFYVWFDLRSAAAHSGHASSAAWCEAFARAHGHGLWPGEDFLAPGWARLSVVTPSRQRWDDAVADLGVALQRFGGESDRQSSASPAPKKFTPS